MDVEGFEFRFFILELVFFFRCVVGVDSCSFDSLVIILRIIIFL